VQGISKCNFVSTYKKKRKKTHIILSDKSHYAIRVAFLYSRLYGDSLSLSLTHFIYIITTLAYRNQYIYVCLLCNTVRTRRTKTKKTSRALSLSLYWIRVRAIERYWIIAGNYIRRHGIILTYESRLFAFISLADPGADCRRISNYPRIKNDNACGTPPPVRGFPASEKKKQR